MLINFKMSTYYLNSHISTIPTKRKNKYPISKPSFLISETSNKIIQTLEEKMKMKKSPSSKSTILKQIANKAKPIPITQTHQNIKGKKARSTNRLTSSANTGATSSTLLPINKAKTPKSNSISIRTQTLCMPKANNTKMSLIKKKDHSLDITKKTLLNSSSYHMKNKSSIISCKRENNRLLTSASFTGNKPCLDSFSLNIKTLKNKKGINIKTIPLNDSRKEDGNDTAYNDISEILPSKRKKVKENTPLQNSKKTSFIPVNSLKNMTPGISSKSNKINATHTENNNHEQKDHNSKSNIRLKTDNTTTVEVFKTIERRVQTLSSSSPERKVYFIM